MQFRIKDYSCEVRGVLHYICTIGLGMFLIVLCVFSIGGCYGVFCQKKKLSVVALQELVEGSSMVVGKSPKEFKMLSSCAM